MKVTDFQLYKNNSQKISMLTCYDYWSAALLNESHIDCLLVGDTSAVIMHGHTTTVPATIEMLATHVHAVSRGATRKFIIGDLPFCSYRQGLTKAVGSAAMLMQAGAHAVKLEGAKGNLEIISHLIDSGIPVMGHLGLTPQSVNQLGGHKVQGKAPEQIKKIIEECLELEHAGCFAIVLECIPAEVAATISQQLTIPTIGIGAGPHTDGQVLVLQDMLGFNPESNFKFLKKYLDGAELVLAAVNQYNDEVKAVTFPSKEHSYS